MIVPWLRGGCNPCLMSKRGGLRYDSPPRKFRMTLVRFLRGESLTHRPLSESTTECRSKSSIRVIHSRLFHLSVQVDHCKRAIFHGIAGAKLHAILESAGKNRPVKRPVTHGFLAAIAQLMRIHVRFLVGGKINRLTLGEIIF